MVDVVLGLGGHLKAEHGTGRNIAPFVERQWGAEAVGFMRRIKQLLDPGGILNPGVVLNQDPQAHLRHLKTLPAVASEVDRCIECGFCEPVCPSRDLTYSPRQRIAALRAVARGGLEAAAIRDHWQHRGLDTCAGDGMCETACPVHIDTGALVRAERAARRPGWMRRGAVFAAEHYDLVVGIARLGLRLASFARIQRLPGSPVPLPPPSAAMPGAWPLAEAGAPTLLYLPTCLGRMMGPGSLAADLAALCRAAGVGLAVPGDAGALCCGQPFASKGFPEAADDLLRRTAEALLAAGEHPLLVSDTSTCAAQLEQAGALLDGPRSARWRALRRLSPATAVAEILLPRLRERGRLQEGGRETVLHPTCSEHRHGWIGDLERAAGALGRATVPGSAGCCGMAGDKGWSTPGLTAAATRREAAEVAGATAGVVTSATCGLALGAASGVVYRHLFQVLAERLVPPAPSAVPP
jgi:D-lactate dehydrogenase